MNLVLIVFLFAAFQEPTEFRTVEALMAGREKASGPVDYVNEGFGYRVRIPGWANLQETGSDRVFGALMPEVAGVRNAVAVKATPKDEFADFEAFRKFVIEDNQPDQPFIMNRYMTFKKSETLAPVTETRAVYKAVIASRGVDYHCKMILVEGSKAWLLIDLFATEATYDQNVARFDEFAKGVTVE